MRERSASGSPGRSGSVGRFFRGAVPVFVVLAGLTVSFLPAALRLPDVPLFVGEGIAVLGCLWGWSAWRKQRAGGRLAAAVVATLLTGGHLYWLGSLVNYAAPSEPPALGARVEIEAVRVRDGAPFRLGEQRGRGVLLVVFRGSW